MEDEALDTRGRNLTLGIFAAVVVLIAGVVLNNYRIKQDRIAGLRSYDPARRSARIKEMMQGFTNNGQIAEQLQGEKPSVRMAAVRALLGLKDDPDEKVRTDAAKLMIPFLKDSDQAVKDLTNQSLTAMGPKIAMPAVTDALADSDGSVKGGAQAVCQNFGPQSFVPLLQFTPDDKGTAGVKARLRTDARVNAGNALAEVGKNDPNNPKGFPQKTDFRTVILFGPKAFHAEERHLTGEQLLAEVQKFLKIEQPLVAKPDIPWIGLVEYLDPVTATEEDQNNVISVIDRLGDQRAVPYLLPKLDTPATRRAAVGTLGRLSDKRATDRLVHYLPLDETNRLEIVIALGKIADPRAADALIRYGLGSVSEPVRNAASDSLRSIGPAAVPKLIAAAKGIDPADPLFYKAEGAVRALAGIRVPAATQAAVAALKHPSDNVREAAASSLGDSGTPSVVPALIAAFEDKNGRVSGFAARSITAYPQQAVAPLVEALSNAKRVYWASLAIRFIGQPAVDALKQKVVSGDPRGALAAATLLGDLGDPRAIDTLKQALAQRRDPDFEFAASSSIQRLGGGAAPEAPAPTPSGAPAGASAS